MQPGSPGISLLWSLPLLVWPNVAAGEGVKGVQLALTGEPAAALGVRDSSGLTLSQTLTLSLKLPVGAVWALSLEPDPLLCSKDGERCASSAGLSAVARLVVAELAA